MHDNLGWFAASGLLALIVAAVARQRGFGFALPVLLVGAFVGSIPYGPSAPLHPEVALISVLAPLVFGEALGSSYLDIRRVSRPVLGLAVGLVIITTAAIGLVISWAVGVPLAMGFALGAVLAPTDAVAVGTIARKAALPRRLVSILEGESLVNDGTGLTALRVAVIAATAGSLALWQVGLTLLTSVLGGIAVGLAGGWLLAFVLGRSRDVLAAGALLLIAPFAVYLLAEEVGGSGILAVVIAALYAAHAQTSDPRQSGRLQHAIFWRQFTFVLQAFAFFLVGLELPDTFGKLNRDEVLLVLTLIGGVVALLILTRMAYVLISVAVGRSWRGRRDFRLAFLAGWAGARGPVSGMAALSIPLTMQDGSPLPYRDLLLATTFGAIVVTMLLAQILGPLARRLGLQPDDEQETITRIKAALAHAALAQLEEAEQQASMEGEPIPHEVIEPLQAQVHARLAALRVPDQQLASTETTISLARLMLRAEQEELIRMRDEEGIPDAIVRPILRSLDVRLQALSAGRLA